MEALPDEAEARREWLSRWGAEQERRAREAQQQRLTTPPARDVRPMPRLARIPNYVAGVCGHWVGRALDRGGLDTCGTAASPEHYSHPDRVAYVPSPWYVLPRALWYLGVSNSDTFVDFGCGKGRVVHQAARRPFRRVIGLEISPVFAEIARTGLAARRHQHRCQNVEIVVADAADFRVPDDLTIGYLFHPFRGKTLAAMLQSIVASLDRRPRRLRLIYVLPTHGSVVLATGRFRLVTVHRALPGDRGHGRTAIFESC